MQVLIQNGQKDLLEENGGKLKLNPAWARSLLKRINKNKRIKWNQKRNKENGEEEEEEGFEQEKPEQEQQNLE